MGSFETTTQTLKVQGGPDVLADQSVTRVYANGFQLGMSNADAFVLLQLFGQPVVIVNMSYTLAKTLSEKLAGLVGDWEQKTKQVLQTTDMIDKAFWQEEKK